MGFDSQHSTIRSTIQYNAQKDRFLMREWQHHQGWKRIAVPTLFPHIDCRGSAVVVRHLSIAPLTMVAHCSPVPKPLYLHLPTLPRYSL